MFLFYVCTKLFQNGGNYSRGDIIQGRILFKEIRYVVPCDDANKSYGKANYDKWSLLLPGSAVAIVSSKVTKTVA